MVPCSEDRGARNASGIAPRGVARRLFQRAGACTLPAMGLARSSVAFVAATVPAALTAQQSASLLAPVRIEADGLPIDVGLLSDTAHAGPALGDVDGDGDRDLLIGDFDGKFWFFENRGTDGKPDYTNRGVLRVDGKPRGEPLEVRTQ